MKTKKALIIGSSMAGILAARVCSDHFEEVSVLEKDEIIDQVTNRKGIPQDNHLHILLSKGHNILEYYFPGLMKSLVQQGAIAGDLGKFFKWYHEGGYRPQITTGVNSAMMSRALLEYNVRSRLLQIPNVKIIDSTKIQGFFYQDHRIHGVETDKGPFSADLIIDARGFGSRLAKELEEFGYERPEAEEVKINLKYTSCVFSREDHFQTLININSNPPNDSKHGTVQPIENGRMIVTVQGRINDQPPKSIDSFIEYTKSLQTQDIYQAIKGREVLTELHSYNIPVVRWLHYEKLSRFPEGILPLGDSVCRLNPIYGQGMSSAAMQAQILDDFLRQNHGQSFWKPYFKKVANTIRTPWELTVTEDFKFPETLGTPPPIPGLMLRYFNKVSRIINQDPVVYKSFIKVLNLVSSPMILLQPQIMWRVLLAK